MRREDNIRAGDLNQLVSIYGPQYTGDEVTGQTLLLSGISAMKVSLRGNEQLQSGREMSEQWATWTIRYRADLIAANTLTHGGDRWDIQSIQDPTGAKRILQIQARLIR